MKARLDCSDSTKSSEPDASKLEGHYGLVPQAGLDASLIGDMYDVCTYSPSIDAATYKIQECIFLFQEAGDHAAHFPHFSVEKRIYHYSIDMAGRYEQTLKHPSHVKYIAQLSDVALSLQLTHANLLQAFNLIFVWADHIEFQDCSVLSQVAKTIEFFFRAIHRFDSGTLFSAVYIDTYTTDSG